MVHQGTPAVSWHTNLSLASKAGCASACVADMSPSSSSSASPPNESSEKFLQEQLG